jgi:hypothetical protein
VLDELDVLRPSLDELYRSLADRQQGLDGLLTLERAAVREQAAIAAVEGARLLVDRIVINGHPGQRLRIRRRRVGAPVERRLGQWVGVTRCETPAADVREMWARLMEAETNRPDDRLRGQASTILEIPDAVAALDQGGTLRVTMEEGPRSDVADAIAIPRCTYALPPRKRRNFGHWLVDCVPQVDVLTSVDPAAMILVAPFERPFQSWALTLARAAGRFVEWDGRPVAARRVVLFESDGRTGGGRPLSALTALRQRLLGQYDAGGSAAVAPEPWQRRPSPQAAARGDRRFYVTRRDARNRRKWVSNEEAIEQIFARRGFEIVSMADVPFDDQARLFRQARVVAGVSGAGLTDLLFSPPGTHAIVLISDSLMRWYADDRGARSFWADGRRGGDLAELGDSPRFYTHLAAAFEQYCHTFVGADDMPLDPLAAFVDETLARVESA